MRQEHGHHLWPGSMMDTEKNVSETNVSEKNVSVIKVLSACHSHALNTKNILF